MRENKLGSPTEFEVVTAIGFIILQRAGGRFSVLKLVWVEGLMQQMW